MATLKLENVNKIYPNGIQAVYDFNLVVQDKEFIVFVGPSGCGKSTTLRMIAGLEDITFGNLYIDDELVNDVLPKDRDIEMVFQNYALFPHLDVYENLAFSLKIHKRKVPVLDKEGKPILVVDKERIRSLKAEIKMLRETIDLDESKAAELSSQIEKKEAEIKELKAHPSLEKRRQKKMPKAEIDERVKNVASILGLTPYLKSRPAELSGGQRQRVALGRAIVRNAKVFLMDEPLSNLDAKLRIQMRSEIIRLHRELGATTIYVTHDQTEAMTMATRIVVMKLGRIQQVDTPYEIYNHPANLFVAGFIGSPSMNFLHVKFDAEKGEAATEDGRLIAIPKEVYAGKDIPEDIILGIRPENIVPAEENEPGFDLKVDVAELLGNEYYAHSKFGGIDLVAKFPATKILQSGDTIHVAFRTDKIHFFDVKTEKAYL